jgi:hypothetical protein
LSDPRLEYSNRLESHLKSADAQERNHRRFGNFKLATIAAGIATALLSLHSKMFTPYWILAPVAIYAALAIFHEFTLRAKTRAESAAAFYQRGLARIEDLWPGHGSPGDGVRDPQNH